MTRRYAGALEYTAKVRMPFCVLGVREGRNGIVGIDYLPTRAEALAARTAIARRAAREFEAYIADATHAIDVPWSVCASEFEMAVWEAIRAIPAGQVRTYGDIAKAVRSIPRAVGGACGRNPLPLIIPCHRVVAAGGLGGFMGGRDDDPLAIKRWLLTHEGVLTRPLA
jgi:methylated-DNA-[protein]-cysteine S-methyltransferase